MGDRPDRWAIHVVQNAGGGILYSEEIASKKLVDFMYGGNKGRAWRSFGGMGKTRRVGTYMRIRFGA
jgi:hypothetical protein